MAKAKAKVKQHFSHQGKTYKPGDEFEGEQHEIETLAQQGQLEHPQGTGGQPGGQPGGAQSHAQGQGAQPPGSQSQSQSGQHDDPSKPHDPTKPQSGR